MQIFITVNLNLQGHKQTKIAGNFPAIFYKYGIYKKTILFDGKIIILKLITKREKSRKGGVVSAGKMCHGRSAPASGSRYALFE